MSTVTTTINHGITLGTPGYYSPLTISGTGAVSNGTGPAVFGTYGTVINYGQVTASGTGNGGAFAGVYLSGGTLDNRGTVTAVSDAAVIQGGSVINSGVLSGGHDGVFAQVLLNVTNTGSISGGSDGINLFAGGMITNTNQITGANGLGISGGVGTVVNSGTINATYGSGIRLGTGGTVSNSGTGLISAGGAYFGIYISGGAGTVVNSGTISGYFPVRFAGAYNNTLIDSGAIIGSSGTAVAFGAGNDLLLLQPSTSLRIIGTVDGGGGTNTLELASGASIGTITGIGVYSTNFSIGTVDVGAQWDLIGTNSIAAGVSVTSSGTLIDDGTLTNAGSLTVASYRGLQLALGSSLTNLSTGVIARDSTGNTGFSPAIIGLSGGAATVANFGTILNLNGNAGLYLQSGVVGNYGSAALIEANGNAIYSYLGSSTVINTGTIESTPSLNGNGIVLVGGGTVSNGTSGSTVGLISGGQYGVFMVAAGTVSNFGTINATNGYGIVLQGGGTVTDAGTISGSAAAVRFGGNNNLLVLERGYSISGLIIATGTANTVELLGSGASAAVTANFNNLQLQNFGTIAFAAGNTNYATLQITNNAALPGTISGFIGSHDTIDLTTLSDVGNDATTSLNTLTNVLTVTGDNGSVALQLDSENYSGIAWVASNDGSGGTNVTARTATGLPSIIGARANQAVLNETPIMPFATVTEVDPNVADTPTVTVTLSSPGNGTLSNLSGGSYDPTTGVYQVTGSAAADTAALQALVFTPTAQANVNVTTTVFTISPGGGGAADSTTSVTSVQQILSLADLPASQIVISVSPDGSGFGAPVAGKTNEAVVSAPVQGGSYTVPTGYQALFLGGTTDATLSDGSVGNAILVANSGNDQLYANTPNDVLVAGSGNDTLFGGSFANTVVGGAGAATVFAGSGAMRVIRGSGPLTFVGGAGTATVTGGTGAETITAGPGGLVYLAAASGHATVNSGTGSVTMFGAAGSSTNLTGSSGNPDYMVAGDGNETLNASASSSSNWLSVSTAVTSPSTVTMIGGSGSDTLIGGSAAGSTIMTGGDGADAFVFFKQAAGNARDIITDFNANDSVFIEGYGPGSASALQNAAVVGAGGLTLTLSDNTTITFSNLTSAQSLDGKIQYG